MEKMLLLPIRWTTAAMLVLATAGGAYAQAYPNRPIRIVVPFAAGGTTDQMARIVQQQMQEILGQPVIIDNKAGAGGAIGTDAVAKSAPDGYALLFGNAGTNALAFAIKGAREVPGRDLMPISFVARVPLFLAVHPSVPAGNAREFIDLVKANPGKYNYGSTGVGTTSHMFGEYFNVVTGLKMTHVPYKGGAPAMLGFIGGEIQAMFVTGVDGLPHVRAGKLKILAITTEKPTDLAPGVPALAETVPGFHNTVWFGLLAPAGTPQETINRVQDAVARSVARPNVKKTFSEMSVEAVSNTPEQFARTIAAEIAHWTKVAKESGATFE